MAYIGQHESLSIDKQQTSRKNHPFNGRTLNATFYRPYLPTTNTFSQLSEIYGARQSTRTSTLLADLRLNKRWPLVK